MTEEKYEKLYFSLGENFGQLVTDIAREKAWNDCKEAEAILFLMDNFDMSKEYARDIVHGKLKLETCEDGKTVKTKPDNFTPPDFEKLKKEIEKEAKHVFKNNNSKRSWMQSIYSFFNEEEINIAENMARDILETLNYNVLSAKKKLLILENFRNNVRQRLRHVFTREFSEYKKDENCQKLDSEVLEELKKNALSKIASSDMDEKSKRHIMRVMEGQTEAMTKDIPAEVDNKFKYDTGWLSPEGIYYGCKPGQHIALSETIVTDILGIETTTDYETYLENQDWAKCTDKDWWHVENLTTQQKLTIRNWAKVWSDDNIINLNGTNVFVDEI